MEMPEEIPFHPVLFAAVPRLVFETLFAVLQGLFPSEIQCYDVIHSAFEKAKLFLREIVRKVASKETEQSVEFLFSVSISTET